MPTIKEAQDKKRGKGNRLPVYTPKKNAGEQGSVLPKAHGLDLQLVEIFDSVQGEGLNAGCPMTFVRFSKCNLACDFCDTPYNKVNVHMSAEELVQNLLARDPRWILFTGGEPCLQLRKEITAPLRGGGRYLGIETNGQVWSDALEHMDHITISPKLFKDTPDNPVDPDKVIEPRIREWLKRADWASMGAQGGPPRARPRIELRYVICGAQDDIFDLGIPYDAICLSPVFHDPNLDPNYVSGMGHHGASGEVDQVALNRCLALVHKYRHLGARLSVQTHKLLGAR